MKTLKPLIAAAVLSSLFASFAVASESTPADQQKVGISATAGTNLGSLEDQLAQKLTKWVRNHSASPL